MKTLKTAQEIRDAVDKGQTVHMGNEAYVVIKDKLGQYFIKCTLNNSLLGLTWADDTTLNGEDFYTNEQKQ